MKMPTLKSFVIFILKTSFILYLFYYSCSMIANVDEYESTVKSSLTAFDRFLNKKDFDIKFKDMSIDGTFFIIYVLFFIGTFMAFVLKIFSSIILIYFSLYLEVLLLYNPILYKIDYIRFLKIFAIVVSCYFYEYMFKNDVVADKINNNKSFDNRSINKSIIQENTKSNIYDSNNYSDKKNI